MNPSAITATIPLQTGTDGVIRVGQTRVTLDVLIRAFKNGSTAEEIVFQYPVLDLADVYAVISYYLKNRVALETYMQKSEADAEKLRIDIQEKFPSNDIRQRLMARNPDVALK